MSDRTRLLALGALAGAVIGIIAALVAAEAAEERKNLAAASNMQAAAIMPSTRDWVKFGVAAVALLRQLADMLTPHGK